VPSSGKRSRAFVIARRRIVGRSASSPGSPEPARPTPHVPSFSRTTALLESRRGAVRHCRSLRPPAGCRPATAPLGGRRLPIHPSLIAPDAPAGPPWAARGGPAARPDDQRGRLTRAELPVAPPALAGPAGLARPRRRAAGSHGTLRERRLRPSPRRGAARGTAGGGFLAARGKPVGAPIA